MKKNIASVIDAFHAHESHWEQTCSTDGEVIRSYEMVIAIRRGRSVYVLAPSESPSRTTTSQIRAVLAALPGCRASTQDQMGAYLETLLDEDEDGERGMYFGRDAMEDFHADG